MKYASIDIETTGLTLATCQMLEFGCVLDDMEAPIEQLPTFHTYIVRPHYVGEPYALSMHTEIFRRIADREPGYNFYEPLEAFDQFEQWLQKNNMDWRGLNVAGKNFASFDRNFILKDWPYFKCKHRILDLGSAFYNPMFDRDGIPDLKACMERVGMTGSVQHNALDDAMDCVKIFRARYAVNIQQLKDEHDKNLSKPNGTSNERPADAGTERSVAGSTAESPGKK